MVNEVKIKVLTLLIFTFIATILIGGCIQEETPKKVSASQSTETHQTIQSESIESEPPTELDLKIGETAKTSTIEVTVFSAQKTKSYEYYSDILGKTMTQEATPGKIYILVDAEIKNVGADSIYAGASEFSVTDSEGYKYDPELYYGNDGLDIMKELYKNQKMRGKILFEVPESAKDLKIIYDFGDLLVGPKLASWSLD